MFTRRLFFLSLAFISMLVLVTPLFAQGSVPTDKAQLGQSIFFDQNLSIQRNQSCSSCHAPESGWTGPLALTNAHGAVYEGSIAGRFGNRKPPSSAYATQSPILKERDGLWTGGNFWDGRATGGKLGNPAADQAQGPFLNPKEQALPDSACVVYRVCNGAYSVSFSSVWGASACAISWPAGVDVTCRSEGTNVNLSPVDRTASDSAYNEIALSIAAYEASPLVNAFTSKFDYVLKGKAQFTPTEMQGFRLFLGKANCAGCHVVLQASTVNGAGPLFTDYSYDNLGIPKNRENPVYQGDPGFVDEGLGGFLENSGYPADVWASQAGRVKVPTLRNLNKRPTSEFVKAYGHNGYFKSLEEIVHFYNTRDVMPTCLPGDTGQGVSCWPPPEHPQNVNRTELGNLGLTPAEEAAVVAFLKTLSDGYTPH